MVLSVTLWISLLGLISLKHADCRAVPIRNGVEFAQALAADDVSVLLVENDLHVDGSAWEGLVRPLLLRRNVTIQASLGTTMPILTITSSDNSVRLAEGVTLMVTGFINIQNRARLGLQSPGVDLLAPCPANESGSFVVLQNGMLVHAVCWPPGLQAATLNNMTRPAAFPGVQQLRPTLPAQALNCSNSSDVHPLERCWPLRGLYQDVAMSGQDPDEQGQLWPTNIFLRLLNMQFACVAVMTETCLKELGPTACFLYMSSTQRVAVRLSPQRPSAPGPSLPPSVAAAAVSVRPGGGEVSGSNRGRAGLPLLVVVLPCVLGVLLITTVAAVFVWFLAARYWRADRRAGWRLPGHSDGSDKLAAASGADSPPAGAQLCKGRSSESLDPVGSQGSTDVLQRQPSKGGGAGPRNRLDAGYGEAARRAHAVMSSTTAETAEVKVLAGTSVGGYILAPDALVIVTPFTPHRSDLKLDVQCDTEVKLLPVVRGQGNFGRVVEGLYGGQRVAVKLVPDLSQWSGAGGPAALQSYVQEVEVLGRCQHPNVVRLLAACVTPPRLCLVMELMDTSLDRLIHAIPQPGPPQQAAPTSTGQEVQLGTSSVRGGASSRSDGCGCGGSSGGEGGREISDRGFMLMPLDKVLHVGLEVARGLEYLHPTIVHRDLKPGNVLLNDPYGPRPVVKLTDFGLSRLRSSVLVTRHPEAGTPPYMAPELYDITNNVVTDKSDMYSLGVLLWEMLSGLVPWQGCDPLVVAYAVTINQDRLPLSNIPPERLPHKLQRLMERLWDHDPLRRPAAAEVVKQLALIQQDVARQEGRQLVAASVQPQLQIHLDPQPQCEVPAQQPRQQQPQPQVDAEAAS